MAYWRKATSEEHPGFINPYNYVRLSSREVQRYDAEASDERLCGVISCTLTTKTPLIIPDFEDLPPRQASGEAHKCGENRLRGVPFFRQEKNGLPTIPGSEIRGVIRSAFETLDNGCFSVNNSNVASSRSPVPKEPGIIEHSANGEWHLYKAEMTRVHGGEAADEDLMRKWPRLIHNRGQTQDFRLAKRAGAQAEVLINQDEIVRAVNDYLTIVEMYCNNDRVHAQLRNNGELSVIPKPSGWDGRIPEGEWPVFYALVESESSESILYLSPAQIGRTVFHNRVDDLLGSHMHCTNSKDACESCHLFGLVSQNGVRASKLRFTDATLMPDKERPIDSYLEGGYRLHELSSPKTSSVEFYTSRPVDGAGKAAATWTYDTATFSYVREGKSYKPQMKAIAKPDRLAVRGRKYYLHHPVGAGDACRPHQACAIKETPRNMTAEAVAAESPFTFKVYFDGVTEAQLRKLVWTLCIGENITDGAQLHKFGHAKPLGFGSAKVKVEQVLLRDVSDSYSLKSWDDLCKFNGGGLSSDPDERVEGLIADAASLFDVQDEGVIRDFLIISNWNLVGDERLMAKVSYPIAIDQEAYDRAEREHKTGKMENAQATHQWFSGNRHMGDQAQDEMTTPSVYRALPALPRKVSDGSVLVLPKLIRDSDALAQITPPLEYESTCLPSLRDVKENQTEADATVQRNDPKPQKPLKGGLNSDAMRKLMQLKERL